MPEIDLDVDGMHCTGCENRIENKLSELEGVRSVDADHETGRTHLNLVAGSDEPDLEAAIEQLGFEVTDRREA